jgi:uncharacterized protein YbaP (TraB family)
MVCANEHGIFWKLKAPNGSTHYLFGTMHTDDNRIITFLPIVKQSLNASDLLVVEIASDDHAKNLFMSKHSLTSDLNEAELNQIKKLSEFHVMYFENVVRMKPWLLAIIFDSPKPSNEFNQDFLLMSMASDLDKDVTGIESSQEHFAIMEMQMVLMRLYFQYEIHFATDKAPVLHPLVTLKPKEPIYFTIQKRKL